MPSRKQKKQRHPRDIVRDAIEMQQHQPENPVKGLHVLLIMLSLVAALCCLAYEVITILDSKGISLPKDNKSHSVRYLNDINDVHVSNYYDYIIVGAGTAGSVLAARLASDRTHPRILLIDSKSINSMVQNAHRKVIVFNPIPRRDRLSIKSNNHHKEWVSSSLKSHQHNIWSIGHREDYDQWNLSGFRWKDVVPYFKKSEKMMIPEIIEQFGISSVPSIESMNSSKSKSKSRGGLMQKVFGRKVTEEEMFDYGSMDISHHRGHRGLIGVKQSRRYSMVNAFLVNAMDHGYTYNLDHNALSPLTESSESAESQSTESMVNTAGYQQFKLRSIFSSYIERLRMSKMGKNGKLTLDVLFNAKVTQILFPEDAEDSDNGERSESRYTAIGVEIVKNSKDSKDKKVPKHHRIYLREDDESDDSETVPEVIVSAGTLESPKLLMLSGFGDTELLKECCGIKAKVDIPEIGRNLQSQMRFSLYFEHDPAFKVITKREIEKWKYKLFSGTMMNQSGFDGVVYYGDSENEDSESKDSESKDSERKDLVKSQAPKLQFTFFNGIEPTKVYNPQNVECVDTAIIDGVTIDVVLLHPESSGLVTLKSTDSSDGDYEMIIDMTSSPGESDLNLLVKGFREIERVFFGKEPFHGTTTKGHFWPCHGMMSTEEMADDAVIKRYIANNVRTNHNRVGTNRLGTVVNEQFILKHTTNVRVVDGSVIPSLISGHVQATIVMLAEKAADLILQQSCVVE